MEINKNDFIQKMCEDRNDYVKACERRKSLEDARIEGVNFMLERMINYFGGEPKYTEDNNQ